VLIVLSGSRSSSSAEPRCWRCRCLQTSCPWTCGAVRVCSSTSVHRRRCSCRTRPDDCRTALRSARAASRWILVVCCVVPRWRRQSQRMTVGVLCKPSCAARDRPPRRNLQTKHQHTTHKSFRPTCYFKHTRWNSAKKAGVYAQSEIKCDRIGITHAF